VVILGIDPGSNVTGYGLIEQDGGRLRLLDAGAIRAGRGDALPARLRLIHDALAELLAQARPGEVAIESVFAARNAHSALVLGHARGVALLAVSLRDIPVVEYAPREVKLALTGHGAAGKEQVRFMVQRLLALPRAPASLDASDALAIAICHAQRRTAPPATLPRRGGAR
jgi:crossover junction endodeoxyribonuclease RuvC